MPDARPSYANFRDPVGLVVRMLRSGDRAARSALLRAGTTLLATPLDLLLSVRERGLVDRAPAASQPLILIVGPPRSGSTLLYQLLAASLPVSYFTNWCAMFPRSPITASRLGPRPRAPRGRPDLESFYGNTRGLRAPNDGFHVWNRWLGHDRYRAPDRLDDATSDAMRRFFGAWTRAFPSPFLNKNNRNASCVSLLARTLPGALFVRTARDPLYVAQSLLLARERIQGGRGEPWGLGSERAARPEDPIEDVAGQVDHVERMLDAQTGELPPGRLLRVDYEDLCRRPIEVVARVYRRVWEDDALTLAGIRDPGPLSSTNRQRLPDEEFSRLASAVQRLRSPS